MSALTKALLQQALKKMPADATQIRVARLWRKDLGNFEYISFLAPKANQFHWDVTNQQHVPKGLKQYIKRFPENKDA